MENKKILCPCGKAYWPKQSWMHEGHVVANTAPVVVNSMANDEPDVANTSTYKYRDAEKRRAYQRELMRKRRAEKV